MSYLRPPPPGQYLVIDEITGKELHSGEMVQDWDGSLRERRNADGEHPDYWDQQLPEEAYPRLIAEQSYEAYVTASAAGGEPVVFYEGTDVPRLLE